MKKLNYAALGLKIKDARLKAGLTQEKLAERCELSGSHIGHIERGSRIPSLEVVYNIAYILDVNMDFLLFNSLKSEENIFKAITDILKTKEETKVKNFINTVKILADKIDDL